MRKQRAEEYQGYREAGIRLTEQQPPNQAGQRSERVEPILEAVHQFDKAHLVMLAEEGLIERKHAATMLATLVAIEMQGIGSARVASGGGVHSAEYVLIRRHGEEVGGRISLGRSSGDIGATATRILQRDKLLEVMIGLNRLRRVVVSMGRAHVESVMPGYAYSRHAQPITLGHQLAAWGSVFERDFERALQAISRINVSPTGAAIMTGSDFPLNRHRTCELLGFDHPAPNTFDAIMSRDAVLDSFSVLAVLNADLARLATDLLLFSTSEFAMADIPDRFCGTSSIMSQIKNPGALQVINAVAAATVGGLTTALISERGPTGSSIVERNYGLHSLAQLHDDTVRDLGLIVRVLPSIRWDTSRMLNQAGRFWAQATDVAGALVREKGLPWRSAHQVVGILVRYCEEQGLDPAAVTTELLDQAAREYQDEPVGLSEESLRRALDPRHFIESRDLYGGPAPSEVVRQLDELASSVERDEACLSVIVDKIKAAASSLDAAVSVLLGTTESEA